MDKPTFYMMIGVPGSGKSTWINNLENKDKFWVLSTDNIIEALAERDGKTYSDVWQKYIKDATKEMNAQFLSAIKGRHSIIRDQTNLTRDKRTWVLRQLPYKGYNCIAVAFEVPKDVLLDRVKERGERTGKKIDKNIILNMYDSYEKPTKSEGFDEVIIIKQE
jgi:predicted kinase